MNRLVALCHIGKLSLRFAQRRADGWRGPFDNLRQLISEGESPNFTSRHYHITAFIEKMKLSRVC